MGLKEVRSHIALKAPREGVSPRLMEGPGPEELLRAELCGRSKAPGVHIPDLLGQEQPLSPRPRPRLFRGQPPLFLSLC